MRICRLLRHLPIVFFWFAAGCASLNQPFRELPRLSLPDHPRLYDKIKHDEKLVKDFLKCSGETYGLPSTAEPANSSTCAAGEVGERAACVAAHLVRGNLEQMFAKAPQDLRAQVKDLVDLDGRGPTSGPIAGKLSNAIEAVEHKIAPRGYVKLLAAMPQFIEYLHARIRDDEERMTQSGSRFERLLVAYNKAYFGDMKFEAAPDAPHMQIKGVVLGVPTDS
jgi:hypothetical protein